MRTPARSHAAQQQHRAATANSTRNAVSSRSETTSHARLWRNDAEEVTVTRRRHVAAAVVPGRTSATANQARRRHDAAGTLRELQADSGEVDTSAGSGKLTLLASDRGLALPARTELERDLQCNHAGVYQILLPLTAAQLAHLWLREPTLTQRNVFAWSEEASNWVPACKISECTEQLSKVRIERVQTLSALYLARASATLAAPMGSRRTLDEVPELRGVTALDDDEYVRLPALPARSASNIDLALSESLAFAATAYRRALPWLGHSCRRLLLRVASSGFTGFRRHVAGAIGRPRMDFLPLALVASFTFAFCLSYFASRENQEYRATRLQALRRAQPATQTISASTLPPVLVGAPPSPARVDPPTVEAHKSSKQTNATTRAAAVAARTQTASPLSTPAANSAAATTPMVTRDTTSPQAAPEAEDFDAREVRHALALAMMRARDCAEDDLYGKVVVMFNAKGTVQSVGFMSFTGETSERTCVLNMLSQIKISPFIGETLTIRKSFHVVARGTGN